MDTLYLKLEQKKQVSSQKALLGDVATLICAEQTVVNRLNTTVCMPFCVALPTKHLPAFLV